LLAATEGDVRWVGHVTGQRKQDLLERSAFVMMPSRAETFGLVALEGMVCGKPIVHFGLPTLRWMDGDVRVAPYDVDAMAIQIRNLADDERVRYELGRAGYAAAQQLGDTDKMADRYLTMVQELIDVQRADLGLDGVPSSQ
jgi:glycosyltransferase involved in cell wall biosynthesis